MLSVELVDPLSSYHYDRLGNIHTSAEEITHAHILLYGVLVQIAGHALTLPLFLILLFKMRVV